MAATSASPRADRGDACGVGAARDDPREEAAAPIQRGDQRSQRVHPRVGLVVVDHAYCIAQVRELPGRRILGDEDHARVEATVATGRAVERRGDQGEGSGIAADEVGPAALAEQQPRIGPELVDAPGSIESRGNSFHSRPFQLPRDTVPEDLVGAAHLLEVVHRETRRERHRGRLKSVLEVVRGGHWNSSAWVPTRVKYTEPLRPSVSSMR